MGGLQYILSFVSTIFKKKKKIHHETSDGSSSTATTTTTIRTTSSVRAHPDRIVGQAIIALKKGAKLLKYRHRGKPKFCPFRLSADEKLLIWYSGKEQKQLSLNSVTKIIPGTVNFCKRLQPEKESKSFSITYANGERSLDLMCKDKEQAEIWMVGLRALVFRSRNQRPSAHLRSHNGAQICDNFPVGYTRRKHNLDELPEVHSLSGSPPRSLQQGDLKEKKEGCASLELHSSSQSDVGSPSHEFPAIQRTDYLRDVLIWGEGVEGGNLGGVDSIGPGTSTQSDALSPKLLESTALLDVQNISFGGKHAALVTMQGEVFCWGKENGRRLGNKVSMDVPCPKTVVSSNGSVHVKSVACGEYHTCALTTSGELYTWGDCGLAANLSVGLSHRIPRLPKVFFSLSSGMHVSSVACGDWHTAIVSSSGQLFTVGDGTYGVLGHGNLQSVSHPKEVDSLKGLRVKSVACGPWHTAAVVDIVADHNKGNSSSGKLFTWGDGDKGKLGHLDFKMKPFPTCVSRLIDHDFVQVSCGSSLTVGLTDKGTVYTMGSAVHGQLGKPQVGDKSITIVEGSLKGETVTNISSGSYHVVALSSTGRVYTWGKGANGRLGLGDVKDRNTPTLVEALSDRPVETVVCGSSVTAAICLHKSVFSTEQLTCTECKTVFGFTRKKRNCYNCGFSFCRACSSKKALNASLGPSKCKPYHVCDGCFNKLTKFVNSNGVIQHEKTEQSVVTWKPLSHLRTDRERATTTHCLLLSTTLSNQDDAKFIGARQSLSKDGRNATAPMHTSGELSASDEVLTYEVQRLQAQVESLEQQCRIRSEKQQQYQQKIDELLSLAREEVAKSEPSEVITTALTMQLHSLSDKLSDLPLATVDSRQNGNITSKLELVEQDDRPGVYITFATLPSGQRRLRRLRFCGKRFSVKEAKRWWEENQQRVLEKYEIKGFIEQNDEVLPPVE